MTSPADPKAVQAMPAWVAGNPVPPEVRLGKILQNEFHILRVLGEGELGVTYEAENARLKGKFAVLMLRRELKPTQGMMLSVQKDLRAAQPLQSLGLMPVKMLVDQFDIPGFATELLDGETLRQRLRRGPLRLERAIAIVLYVAKALDALHKAGAVHGDLRPENIFMVRPGAKSSFAGKVVIVEHSLHHLRRRPAGLDDQLPLYKLMYRPPELLAGETGPHPGGDVFVLGAILHECLTGRPAFFDEVADFVFDNLHQPPKKLQPTPQTGLMEELCEPLDELAQCACARDPKERLPDMASLLAGLEGLVRSKGIKLPDVLSEAPDAAGHDVSQSEQRMHRLLERRSGVFPVLGPPPSEPKPPTAAPPTTPSQSAPAKPASTKAAEPIAPLQAITAPKKKVTQILQQLSTAFPVLTVSPDGSAIEQHTVVPTPPTGPKLPSLPEAEPMVVAAKPVAESPALSVPAAPSEPPAAKIEPPAAKAEPAPVASEPAPVAPAKSEEQPAPPAVSLEASTHPKVEPKPVLKANVAEALSRLRKPGLAVEPKGPPPAALPFAVAAIEPAPSAPAAVPAAPAAPDPAPPATPAPAAASAEPPKTAPPIMPAPVPAAPAIAAEPAPDAPKPSSPRRVSESTVQVESIDDLLVSLPSLSAIPIVPPGPPPTPGVRDQPPEPPQTLSVIPTSAALETIRPTHDPALLSAPTRPLLPAMLGDLLTPPVTAPPPASLALESPLTPPVTAAPAVGSLHEAPTRTKLPVDAISTLPTQAVVEALPISTPSVVPVIPAEAKGSGKVDDSGSLHDKPTAASIPSLDLLSRAVPGPDSGPLRDPERLLQSNPILRPEPPKASPLPSPKPMDAPDPKLMLPAQVSTAHTSLAPRIGSSRPVHVPQAAEPGLRALLLKNQEVVAAAVGALIVLLIGLLFYALIK